MGSFKVLLVGDPNVGKTSFIYMLHHNAFPDEFIPRQHDHIEHKLTVDDKEFQVDLWDTPGQIEHEVLRKNCYKNVCN